MGVVGWRRDDKFSSWLGGLVLARADCKGAEGLNRHGHVCEEAGWQSLRLSHAREVEKAEGCVGWGGVCKSEESLGRVQSGEGD